MYFSQKTSKIALVLSCSYSLVLVIRTNTTRDGVTNDGVMKDGVI